jgi:hypothetical protein
MAGSEPNLRNSIRAAEGADPPEQWVLLCLLAGRNVTLDEHERKAAIRRSELLLAAGGDPHRPLELWGRAVTALAEDLDSSTARAQLAAGLDMLTPSIEGLRGAADALRLLEREGDLAWQCYAMGLIAEELAREE